MSIAAAIARIRELDEAQSEEKLRETACIVAWRTRAIRNLQQYIFRDGSILVIDHLGGWFVYEPTNADPN